MVLITIRTHQEAILCEQLRQCLRAEPQRGCCQIKLRNEQVDAIKLR